VAEGTTRARRVALFALVALVACGQAFCVLQLLHVPLWPPRLVLGAESLVVLAAMAAAMRSERTERRELGRWAAIGFGMWAFWGLLFRVAEALRVGHRHRDRHLRLDGLHQAALPRRRRGRRRARRAHRVRDAPSRSRIARA
jgi:hypothetical protein